MEAWVEQEIAACSFRDDRLKARLARLVTALSKRIGTTIPGACQDWAATKAAYRFFSNPRVDESVILAGHFAATTARFADTDGFVLVLHDTTDFSFKREQPERIGHTHRVHAGQRKGGLFTVCGLLMHSSLVLTRGGVPLGLAAVKFWTRKKFKGTRALRNKVNLTRIPIEEKESVRWLENLKQSTAQLADPARCVHVGDRESDIYELFCTAQQQNTHFLVRTCVDRFAGTGKTTVSRKMQREPVRGLHEIKVLDQHRRLVSAKLRVRFCEMTVHPPIAKRKTYAPLRLTVIHADERGKPRDREAIHWKLATSLPVPTLDSAVEKLDWYAQRWKIETFHKVLKSGCRAEASRLQTAERLTNQLAVFCIIAWRVFWLTMINRSEVTPPVMSVFTQTELTILEQLAQDSNHKAPDSVSDYITAVARLGGYLARGKDPPPGNTVLWRGLSRLTDIQLGFELVRGCG